MFKYFAKLVRVVDGDTIDVVIDHGFSIKHTIRLRLANIDTEELSSEDPNKKMLALAAKRFLQELLEDKELIVTTLKTKSGKERETFGRYVALVEFAESQSKDCTTYLCVNNLLLKEGFAKLWEE